MGARKTKGTKDKPWPQITRDRIQGSMIVNRLEKHILGEVELNPSQVTAALGLLKKTLPDLASQTNPEGDGPQELIQRIEEHIVDPKDRNSEGL